VRVHGPQPHSLQNRELRVRVAVTRFPFLESKLKNLRLTLTLILIAAGLTTGRACDLCGCFTPQLNAASQTGSSLFPGWERGWFGAVSEQFTRFGTLQESGNEVPNPTGQYLDSAIMQLVSGYQITSRFALQLNVPLIYREFKRPEGFEIQQGTVSGLGDMSLLLKTVFFHYASPAERSFDVSGKNPVATVHESDFTVSAVLLTGIKFPTGDSSRLKEEFHEVEVPGAPESGIHGHDLTLGTGSYDGVFGQQTSLRYKNMFLETNVQFAARTEGAHDYRFADDLIWNGGPGYYLVRNANAVLGLQFVASGEYKGRDRFRGAPADDTGISSVFLGPRMVASLGRWSAEVSAELPVFIHNTALQAVPDFRLHGAISVQF
jgi:hypothetical protein